MSRRTAVLVNLLFAFFSLAFALGLMELAARAMRVAASGPIAGRYTEADPLLGWRHRPGARVNFPQGPYIINSRGLRDREREYAAPAGRRRILILGDSFAEGFSVRLEDAVSQALERLLDRPGCRCEVVNGGTVGYSTDQEYLFYREEGARYSPTIVVLFLYYNDIVYNGRAHVGSAPKPLFTFAGGVPRVINYPVPAPAPVRSQAEAGASPPGRSAAFEWVRMRLMTAAPRFYNRLAGLRLWPRIERAEPGLELQVYSRHPPPAILQDWNFTVHLLRLLDAEAKSHGAKLLVAYVPSKMEISEKDWELTRLRYGVDDYRWDRGRVARLLTAAGQAAGFPVLDLTEPLRHADRGLLGGPYHRQGGHWNALGHRVAAGDVEAFLRREGWITCR